MDDQIDPLVRKNPIEDQTINIFYYFLNCTRQFPVILGIMRVGDHFEKFKKSD